MRKWYRASCLVGAALQLSGCPFGCPDETLPREVDTDVTPADLDAAGVRDTGTIGSPDCEAVCALELGVEQVVDVTSCELFVEVTDTGGTEHVGHLSCSAELQHFCR